MNRKLSPKPMADRIIVMAIVLSFLFGCCEYELQILNLNFNGKEIRLEASSEFVIDSVCIFDSYGEPHLKMNALKKGTGLVGLRYDDIDVSQYNVHEYDSGVMSCDFEGELFVVIRRRGFDQVVSLRPEHYHQNHENLQVFKGIVWQPCSNEIVSVKAEPLYR